VGQLLGKSKWEKPLADWIMATEAGFLGLENYDLEAEMMDGGVSHSSEIKLLTFRRDVRLFLCFSFSFAVLSSYCHVRMARFVDYFFYFFNLVQRPSAMMAM
jgi:hypothetical protein